MNKKTNSILTSCIIIALFFFGWVGTIWADDPIPTNSPSPSPSDSPGDPLPWTSPSPVPSLPCYSNDGAPMPCPSGTPAPGDEMRPQFVIEGEAAGIKTGIDSFEIITQRGLPVSAVEGTVTVAAGTSIIINIQDTSAPNCLNSNLKEGVLVFTWWNFLPANGNVVVTDQNGNIPDAAHPGLYIKYTPRDGFVGNDQFGYRIVANGSRNELRGKAANIIKVRVE